MSTVTVHPDIIAWLVRRVMEQIRADQAKATGTEGRQP